MAIDYYFTYAELPYEAAAKHSLRRSNTSARKTVQPTNLEKNMDPAEFREFDFRFMSTDSNSRQNSTALAQPAERHVRWGELPKPDRESRSTSDSNPNNRRSMSSNRSAYSINAGRRISLSLEQQGQTGSTRHYYGKRKDPSASPPEFQEVQWEEAPHPGLRIPVDVYEGEMVSPRSETMVVPLWCTDMDAKVFRSRVQPTRITGKRKPGMTVKTMRPARVRREVRVEEREEDDRCLVQ